MYKILLTRQAEKQLKRLAPVDMSRVLEKLPLLVSPFSANLDVKKITGIGGFYRFRIGKMRILFEIVEQEKELWIRKIGYRGGIYR